MDHGLLNTVVSRPRIDTDDIGNLEDLPTLVFIDERCESLVVANDGK